MPSILLFSIKAKSEKRENPKRPHQGALRAKGGRIQVLMTKSRWGKVFPNFKGRPPVQRKPTVSLPFYFSA